MKYLMILLAASGLYAQKQVYNVQEYCIRQAPFSECSQKGNDYSFAFVDQKAKEVVLLLAGNRLAYKIMESRPSDTDPDFTHYVLLHEKEMVDMRINRSGTKMEFLHPGTRIYLTTGKTTKLEKPKRA